MAKKLKKKKKKTISYNTNKLLLEDLVSDADVWTVQQMQFLYYWVILISWFLLIKPKLVSMGVYFY